MSGVDFIFSDSEEYSLYLKGRSIEAVHLNELSIESLIQFLRDNNINLGQEINNLKVKVHNEFGRSHTKPLKFYLDFIEENERHCLIDGVWHKFNQSYIDYLREEVDKITPNHDPSFDIRSGTIEPQFNQDREGDGYLNYDRNLESPDGRYRVEKTDLYKDGVLYFVKKGTPQKLSYVVDQALNTIKILQNNADCIMINEEAVDIKGICLWLILERRTEIQKLSEINSIIFHMKIVEWRKTSIDAGFDPLVNINYIRR